jgi:hypothetical protein
MSSYEYKYRKYKAKFLAAKKMASGGARVSSELFDTDDWKELLKIKTSSLSKPPTDSFFEQYLETAPVLVSGNSETVDISETTDISDMSMDAGQVFAE